MATMTMGLIDAPIHSFSYRRRKNGLVARKQGRGAEKASTGLEFLAEVCFGLRKLRRAIGRPAGRLYNGKTQQLLKAQVARPTRGRIGVSWFFRATPLLSGPAMPEIQQGSHLLAEK